MRPPFDPILNDLAKSFNNLEPFPDPEGMYGSALSDKEDFKRMSVMPGGRMLAIRYFLNGRNRYLAYAPCKRQSDLLRFSDLLTMRLWKYSPRCRHRDVEDADLNFSVELCKRDAADFEETRPEILQKITDIEKHLIETEIIKDQSIPDPNVSVNPRKRKTARAEYLAISETHSKLAAMQHQEMLDAFAFLSAKLDTIKGQLHLIESNTKHKAPIIKENIVISEDMNDLDKTCIISPSWIPEGGLK